MLYRWGEVLFILQVDKIRGWRPQNKPTVHGGDSEIFLPFMAEHIVTLPSGCVPLEGEWKLQFPISLNRHWYLLSNRYLLQNTVYEALNQA